MSESLDELAERISNFRSENIQHIQSSAESAYFSWRLDEIKTELNRLIGYRKGYADAFKELTNATPLAKIAFIEDAIVELAKRVSALKIECQKVRNGRPLGQAHDQRFDQIAERAMMIQTNSSGNLSLRKSIIFAIEESTEKYGPLPSTTTDASHIQRIRRIINSRLTAI